MLFLTGKDNSCIDISVLAEKGILDTTIVFGINCEKEMPIFFM